jgi:type IV secretion system protein VirD4
MEVRGAFKTLRGEQLITYSGDSHLMTIAPTGAGKGRSVIIPNLLSYPGPMIVVDPKGENYAVTARARREMGHQVIKLDPFNQTRDGIESDAFNPFDFLPFTGGRPNDEARMLAELVMVGDKGFKEPFWDNWASTIISGIAIHLATTPGVKDRSFVGMRDILFANDATRQLVALLDAQGKKMDPEAHQEIAAFLSINADVTRSGVLSTAQQFFRLFGNPSVRKTIERTSFSLKDVYEGQKQTIYIIIPPNKLVTHQALLRLWVGSLLTLISHRRYRPQYNTLFIIDEAAQLGKLEILKTAKTLLRGYGLQTWSFWQDFSQIQNLYDTSWKTIVNNCAVLQVFGARNEMVAGDFAGMVGITSEEVRNVDPHEQILIMNGGDPSRALLLNYLEETEFAGRFDDNPLYADKPEGLPEEELAKKEEEAMPEEPKPAQAEKEGERPASPFGSRRPEAPPPPRPAENPFNRPPSRFGSNPFRRPLKNPAAKLTSFQIGAIGVYIHESAEVYMPLVLKLAAVVDPLLPLALSYIGEPAGAPVPVLKPAQHRRDILDSLSDQEKPYLNQLVAIAYVESSLPAPPPPPRDEDDEEGAVLPPLPPKKVYAFLKLRGEQVRDLLKKDEAGNEFDLDLCGQVLAYGQGQPSPEELERIAKTYLWGGLTQGYISVRIAPPMEENL